MDYSYKAKLGRVVDGDTVWLDVDLGFNIWAHLGFRLEGINTPEVVGPASRTKPRCSTRPGPRWCGCGSTSWRPDAVDRGRPFCG